MLTPLMALRQEMEANRIHAYLIPSSDFHGSEYIGAHFAGRTYLSRFTGSAGTLLVLRDWAGLWTDGRYFLQAEQELSGSGISLMRQGMPGVPTIEETLKERLSSGQCLGFDGRCVSAALGLRFQTILSPQNVHLKPDLDLLDAIWKQRPPLSAEPVWPLSLAYAGESRESKIETVKDYMKQIGADDFLLTSLEDIAWLLNLRGGDVEATPVFLSYLAIHKETVTLFANPDIFSEELKKLLRKIHISLRPYEDIYPYAANISGGSSVLLDRQRVNYSLLSALPSDIKILDRTSPTEKLKSVKNAVEICNMKQAHIKDGIALTKFIYWLKKSIRTGHITEQSAAGKLEGFRREQAHYLGPSFSPIVAYGAHAALVHYAATDTSCATLKAEEFLLVDSGGHYLEGTTDCTRTIPLGPLTQEQVTHYTAVLRGNLNLMNACFRSGCSGPNLDYLARSPLWSLGLDYNHGTGHGVGYLLSVHEGPNSIRWKSSSQDIPFEVGMITSNEPGIYLEGQYGIRLENLLLCVERGTSPYGRFLAFEPLTLVPFDLDAIDTAEMTAEECALLNRYHALVQDVLTPHLSPDEASWLLYATRPVTR